MRRETITSVITILLCAALVLCLSACSSTPGGIPESQGAADGVKLIYYSNQEGTELITHEYRLHSEDFDGMLHELLEAFCVADTVDVRSALPDPVRINSAVTGINEIDVDFNVDYLSLDVISELLLRAALVKTLLQLPGVNSVRFTVDSQPLVIDEEEVGLMTEDTFIVPAGNGINSSRTASLTLYFPTGDGTVMKKESRTERYSSNVNKERLVIEKMLEGSDDREMLPVAVEGTLLQDVSVSNGYCIVDFSEEINAAPAGEVIANPETVLYAFTNALIDTCTEDRIIGVRFRIEGSTDVRFRDQVNLDRIFERNAELILPS